MPDILNYNYTHDTIQMFALRYKIRHRSERNMNQLKESKFLLYETEDGKINVDVILKDETIWLSQKSIAELFEKI